MNKLSVPDYLGHRKRIKEKYIAGGLNSWLDYEVLEFALSFAIPRKDTKPIAKELLSTFKTLNGVLDARREDLIKIEGISEHTVLFLKFLKDIAIRYMEMGLYNKNLLSSPDAVYDYLKASLKGVCDEEFRAVFLNNRNGLLAVETIHKGTVNKSVVYPRTVVERALYNHAASVIIAHNHPGESLLPSQDDCRTTKLISIALKTVDIVLLDHVIIGGNNYFSFKENGIEL
ncbi:MAG: DNA repair protein RadC [Candidatus Firestonebacteria bacterium]|nr:DNA repair protein RadC [Candidatus Firestonebacteria bacterium]